MSEAARYLRLVDESDPDFARVMEPDEPTYPPDLTRAGFLANLAATLMKADLLLVYEVGQAVVSDSLIGGGASISPEGRPDMTFSAEEVRVTARGGQELRAWRYAL